MSPSQKGKVDTSNQWHFAHAHLSNMGNLNLIRVMKFQTLKAGLFALLHSTTQDLPYVSWSLAPVYKTKIPLEEQENDDLHVSSLPGYLFCLR